MVLMLEEHVWGGTTVGGSCVHCCEKEEDNYCIFFNSLRFLSIKPSRVLNVIFHIFFFFCLQKICIIFLNAVL
jgi:hypothetical protein